MHEFRELETYGTFEEIVADLEDRIIGYSCMGSPRKSQEAREALEAVQAGEACVRVGHRTYYVRPIPVQPRVVDDMAAAQE